MADYISREAAIERFCNVYCGCSPEECGFKIQQDGAEECAAVRALKETPAADVRPVAEISNAVDEVLDFLNDNSNCMPYHIYSALFDLVSGICPNCGCAMENEK